jgi:hypothetical protein
MTSELCVVSEAPPDMQVGGMCNSVTEQWNSASGGVLGCWVESILPHNFTVDVRNHVLIHPISVATYPVHALRELFNFFVLVYSTTERKVHCKERTLHRFSKMFKDDRFSWSQDLESSKLFRSIRKESREVLQEGMEAASHPAPAWLWWCLVSSL